MGVLSGKTAAEQVHPRKLSLPRHHAEGGDGSLNVISGVARASRRQKGRPQGTRSQDMQLQGAFASLAGDDQRNVGPRVDPLFHLVARPTRRRPCSDWVTSVPEPRFAFLAGLPE